MPDQLFGIIKSYGIGQTEFMWKLRRNKKIRSIFRYLYDVDTNTQLVTSYDGVCYYPKQLAIEKENINLWTHVDIHPKRHSKKEFKTFQSFINLEDNTIENDGAFVLCPHKLNYDFYKDILYVQGNNDDNDFFKVPIEYLKSKKVKLFSIHAPKGTMVIWDSRIIHCNVPPTKSDIANLHDRLVAYICMVPKFMVSKDTLKKLKLWKKTNRTTSHSPINPNVNNDYVVYNKNTCIIPKVL
jgi:hypothetical protein